MTEEEIIAEHTARYDRACHAMQSGVAMQMQMGGRLPEIEPKHLRVGVNSAMAEHSALAQALIAKGIITKREYIAALADAMEREARSYEDRLTNAMGGVKVTLL